MSQNRFARWLEAGSHMRSIRRLLPTAVLVANLCAAALAATNWITNYLSYHGDSDLKIYYLGARIGLTRGWPHIYDLGLQAIGWQVLGDGFSQLPQPDRSFLSPPFVAWLAAPLTILPVPAAYLAWSILIVGSLVLAGWLVSPGRSVWRWSSVLASLWLAPVLLGLMLGQATFLVLAAVSGCWWFLSRDRPLAAGISLAFICLKPNIAFLVPPMLLLLGERRAVGIWFAASAGLALAAWLVVGSDGLGTYLHELQLYGGRPFNTSATIARLTGPGLTTSLLQGGLGGLALVAGWRQRKRGCELPLAAALAGSLLASPYLHPYDFSMLLASVWLVLRASPPAWLAWGMLLAVPASELIFSYGSLPLLAFSAALVVGVALVPTSQPRSLTGPKGISSSAGDGRHDRAAESHLSALEVPDHSWLASHLGV
jgi:Glycosyltransferase family 87